MIHGKKVDGVADQNGNEGLQKVLGQPSAQEASFLRLCPEADRLAAGVGAAFMKMSGLLTS
jgi:hypothetical protein